MLEENHNISILQEKSIVSCKQLFDLFWEMDQNIFYVVDETGCFVGIITIGTLLEQMKIDIDGKPSVNKKCLRILRGESYEKAKDIFEKYHITTSIPVVDRDGNICYEIRKKSPKIEGVLIEFKEKIKRYRKSYYLGREIVCLRRILEAQDVIVIGNEEKFDFLFEDIFQDKKRVVFLDDLESAYGLMCENKRLFIDLQAVVSGGRENIYGNCNNGYTWKQFIDQILCIIEGGYCSAFYDIVDNEWVTLADYLKKYMEQKMDFSARGVFTAVIIQYLQRNHFQISEEVGVFRNISARYNMKINEAIIGKNREDNELTLIEFTNMTLQLCRLSKKLSNRIKVLNFVFDQKAETTDAEKKRMAEGKGCLSEYLSDRKTEILDLYTFVEDQSDGYIDELEKSLRFNQKRTFENNMVLLEDYASDMVNIEDGMRKTCYLPEKYEGTIFFFGACIIYGLYVEDQYTIPSIVQQYINQSGKKYRVVNLGNSCMTRTDDLLDNLNITEDDIAVFFFPNITDNIKKNISIIEMGGTFNRLREKEFKNAECFLNMPLHCGTNGNIIYSKIIFNELKGYLADVFKSGQKKHSRYDVFRKDFKDLDVLYDYTMYITDLKKLQIQNGLKETDEIGCIVMNCNPFTKGHRYLIEYALGHLDYLFIFVVEEDKSFFSFEDRYKMVKMGTADLNNISVVRSGDLIIASNTFPVYFQKENILSTKIKPTVSMDLRIFAQYIAPTIHIRYRFVGEEPNDLVTKEYNNKMKEILPEFGIDVIEIPRKCMDGKIISASLVREYYKRKDFENLARWVPETTVEYLKSKYENAT